MQDICLNDTIQEKDSRRRIHNCVVWIENSITLDNWASQWENLLFAYANNKDADQPAQSDQRLCYSPPR